MEEITENIKALIQEIDPELMIAYLIFSGGATYLNGYIESLNLDVNGRQAKVRPDVLSESADETLLRDYQTALGLVVMATNSCVKSDIQDLEVVFNPAVEEPQEEPQEEPATEEIYHPEYEDERGDRTFIDEEEDEEDEYEDDSDDLEDETEDVEDETEDVEDEDDEQEESREKEQKESKASQMFNALRSSLKGLFSTNEEDNI